MEDIGLAISSTIRERDVLLGKDLFVFPHQDNSDRFIGGR